VTVRNQSAEEQGSPLAVLIDPTELDRQYKVSEGGVSGGLEWLVLAPKKRDDAAFSSARLGFGPTGLARMEMQDSLGQRTVIGFGPGSAIRVSRRDLSLHAAEGHRRRRHARASRRRSRRCATDAQGRLQAGVAASAPLFEAPEALKPLAERMRPRDLDEIVGQQRLLAPGSALRRAIESGHVHSMILWGPPGCGKTTLALLLAQYADADFRAISAVLSGLPEVRAGAGRGAGALRAGARTVLFVDEVHRFNKAQQDAFLPHIERGSILFVGATTENPSFELNSRLLSRCRVHVMESVSSPTSSPRLRRALAMPSAASAALGSAVPIPHWK
jgi:hypothetical protein